MGANAAKAFAALLSSFSHQLELDEIEQVEAAILKLEQLGSNIRVLHRKRKRRSSDRGGFVGRAVVYLCEPLGYPPGLGLHALRGICSVPSNMNIQTRLVAAHNYALGMLNMFWARTLHRPTVSAFGQ